MRDKSFRVKIRGGFEAGRPHVSCVGDRMWQRGSGGVRLIGQVADRREDMLPVPFTPPFVDAYSATVTVPCIRGGYS